MESQIIQDSTPNLESDSDSENSFSSPPSPLPITAINLNQYIIEDFFGVVEDTPDQISWLSIVAAVMSFTYSAIGLALGVSKVIETGKFRGSLTGISIGTVSETQKIWRSFQALGAITFAYSYSLILIEIQCQHGRLE